jgi:hypothetical protein
MTPKKSKIQYLFNFFQKLLGLTKTERSRYIKNITKRELNALCELIKNFLKSNLSASARLIKKLRPHSKDFFTVADRSVPSTRKIKILTTSRGGYILGLLLPLALKVFSKILG